MSLVDSTTGEVVQIADEDTARRLVEQVSAATDTVNNATGVLVDAVAEALEQRAWVALGYGSWADLVDAMGWQFQPRTRTERAALAELWRQSGMSLRAIGKLVNASPQTVGRDLAGVPSGTPDEVTGTDGKQYPASQPDRTSDDGGVSDSESSEPATPADSSPAPSSGHLEDPAGESSTGEDEGTAHDPSSPLLDKLLPDHTAGIDDASFQTELQKAVGQVRKALLTFDTDEVGLRADPENWEQLDLLLKSLGEWFTAVKAARPIGLRVINGEKR